MEAIGQEQHTLPKRITELSTRKPTPTKLTQTQISGYDYRRKGTDSRSEFTRELTHSIEWLGTTHSRQIESDKKSVCASGTGSSGAILATEIVANSTSIEEVISDQPSYQTKHADYSVNCRPALESQINISGL